jgi:ABC-type lipoprotein export system ATPase subunit
VLMITHNPEAAEIGDRILHMRDGHLLEQSSEAMSVSH